MPSRRASSGAKRWLKQRQHAAGIRQALDAGELLYEIVRGVVADDDRPATAGGWPARLMPFPPPRPYGRRERRELARTIRSQNTSFSDGDAVLRFERALERHWRCRHAIAVSSGTAALHAALIAAGVGPGDEVIVPVLTHVSTPLAVAYQGAVPRFVDARANDWNIDVTQIEALVCSKTRAIVTVHLCGVPCDLGAIRAIAARHRLRVIEDAAHAHGAEYAGRKVGTIGDLGCLSFQSDKTMTTGEGGAVLTDDDELADRVRRATSLGDLSGRGNGAAVGERASLSWNYRIGALQASLGLGQLERLDALCAARRTNAELLWRRLEEIPGLRRQTLSAQATPGYVFLFVEPAADGAGPTRDELVRCLTRERIDYRLPYAEPLARHALFADGKAYPSAERICANGIGFRIDPSLGRREMETVASALRRIFAWKRSLGSA